MSKIISFANQKGGVGKTTLCLQMAHYLIKRKKNVLVVDLDPQGNSSSRLLPRQNSSHDVEYHEEVALIYEGARSLELFYLEPLKNVCRSPAGMDVIWSYEGDFELAELESASLDVIFNVRSHLKRLEGHYDYILIDCPPTLGRHLLGALVASTDVVCPIRLSGFAISGLKSLMQTIFQVQEKLNPQLKIAGIVVNNMDRSPRNQREYERLKGLFSNVLIQHSIYQRSPIDHASTDGLPIWDTPYGYVASKEIELVLKSLLTTIGE